MVLTGISKVRVLQLGSMCSLESASNLEECHSVSHAVRLINDKTDGFMDHLLPTAYIDMKMVDAGCAIGTDAPVFFVWIETRGHCCGL